MTIQEYIRVAINGFPKDDFKDYREYFAHMDCGYCVYNGHYCRSPKTDGVCIEYEVKKKHLDIGKTNKRHEKKI